ncbi:Di-copper centre-containing protein [Eremomyces bilateralis CBS 781.70]|uniref:Di-copper centre-containing protein n=1 Tax=Eremomyces bilateralis CBS 781.70 TaxID=1392243 RepID=A0A6G1GF28_9PEZI|nr:Di-copper centre-containing protein [Eremomyces bilateralis CBS 781.70]KAF1816602.1 Di-copper centre-containing protein [Eremomyces bilateralis CBS 781.70]
MRLLSIYPLLLLGTQFAWAQDDTTPLDDLAEQALRNILVDETANPTSVGSVAARAARSVNSCNVFGSAKRMEWDNLSSPAKRHYLDSVLCLFNKPSKSGAPGARNRYDDFVVTHVLNTQQIHFTGNFLSWHRYFIRTFEQALQNECGYTGSLPYFNWSKYASNAKAAPLFDGSSTSIGGDGDFKQLSGIYIPSVSMPFQVIPQEGGGGCVTSGAFQNITVNIGPVDPSFDDATPNPQPDGLGYNPRCLRRSLLNSMASEGLSALRVASLLIQSSTIAQFQDKMQGNVTPGPNYFLGVHAAGHYLINGEPGADIFTSTADPYFFLHHAQLDRLWWIWQNLNRRTRLDAIAGTITMFNNPPSRDTSLDDMLDMGVNGPTLPIRDVMDTMDGPLCYIYF